MRRKRPCLLACVLLLPIAVLLAQMPSQRDGSALRLPSVCHGTPARGSLEHGWPLPSSGPNFSAYSKLGVVLGRNHVHSAVYQVVVEAYAQLAREAPVVRYVYGETGNARGGRFRPHKSHQNGTSVDFFVPVRDALGRSVPLPTGTFHKFGYDIEFDSAARYRDLTIDFDAMARHLLALRRAADHFGVGIRVVIFDDALQKQLFASTLGPRVRRTMRFSTKKPWVRHDEHYHVDFIVPCR